MRNAILALALSAAPAQAATLHYTAYAAGLPAAEVTMTLDLTASGYRIGFVTRTVGVTDLLFGARLTSGATGVWAPDGYGRDTLPAHYEARGKVGGVVRDTAIDYDHDAPIVRNSGPVDEDKREPVSPELQARTQDGISAIAGLLRRVERTGSCDGTARTFDGRRLVDTRVHTVGLEQVLPTPRSAYAGPALRCDFEGRLLAGFKVGENKARAARPIHGSVWLARVDGLIAPVRMTFETRFVGDAVAYLSPPDAP